MSQQLLICTDLDRTLLPNGTQPESKQARSLFSRLVSRPDVSLAYVTGRHRELVLDAMQQYQLPTPDFIIGDVGSSIYEIVNGQWKPSTKWMDQIAVDWHGFTHEDIKQLFTDISVLQLQEPEKQGVYKLSYYLPGDVDINNLFATMQDRLNQHGINASLIWSIDDIEHIGLLDVLPRQATKLHAIEFLVLQKNFTFERTLFAGDSGNDIPVLASHIQSVLVANARNDVRELALETAKNNGVSNALYLAKGDFLDMNGNYAAGILEGIAHYLPETIEWLRI